MNEPLPLIEMLPWGMILAGIMLLGQVFLFGMKIDIIERRPVAKRNINGSVIMVGLLLALLTFTLFIVAMFAVFGEKSDNPLEKIGPVGSIAIWIVLFFGSWTFWALQFYRMYSDSNPKKSMNAMVTTLMAGSVLELLVAIPSHIIMRNRGDCCAPAFSFMGILLGVSVALFAFGPGLVFLYLKRMDKKKPNPGVLDE